MRKGFTTGSCATACAKAAAYMLFSGQDKSQISIITPAGIEYNTKILNIERDLNSVSCCVKKDAGDDPDITDNALVGAKVSLTSFSQNRVIIKGGVGVGIVTRPGLSQPVGAAAINDTPRAMIQKEVLEVMDLFDCEDSLVVEIFVPDGENLAKKTFNPHLGIENGISILGTTGIVEPMSMDAIIKTIELDLSQKKALGYDVALMVPGNYGLTFLKTNYDIDENRVVLFSNYIGDAIDLAGKVGFKKILIVGHTGKLVKLAGGIMNTHSHNADCRMELMCAAYINACEKYDLSIDDNLLLKILKQTTTSACLDIFSNEGLLNQVCKTLMDSIMIHLKKRARDDMQIECMLYENSYGLLAVSAHAKELL